MGSFHSLLISLSSIALGASEVEDAAITERPNILFMMIDDVGFNDLGYLGCTDTATPFIDSLIRDESLLLWHNYAFKMCSPTRSAFLSGRNPNTIGLQNLMFAMEYPVALTRQVSTISDELKANGYTTHCIGKWHLGYPAQEYTPIYRGFDTFSGFLNGMNGYYDHTFMQILAASDSTATFYDYWTDDKADNDTVTRGNNGEYAIWTEKNETIRLLETIKDNEDPFFLYLSWQSSHTPNEAPSKYTDLYGDSDSDRVNKQAQMTILDESTRDVVEYLKSSGLWASTLLVMSSDNGGSYNRGDNAPLRQYKNSSFEGGIRVPGFVTGGFLNDDRRGKVMDEIVVHSTDWYPTLLSAAGLEVGYYRSKKLFRSESEDIRFDHIPMGTVELDGMDIWRAIQYGEYDGDISYETRELVLDLDSHVDNCTFNSCGAIRTGDWKFLRGANVVRAAATTSGISWQRDYTTCNDSLHPDPLGCSEYDGEFNSEVCAYTEKGCLFNLAADPCEVTNLGEEYPELRDLFIARLDYHQSKSPSALILDIDQLDVSEYNASAFCTDEIYGFGTFWCPFLSYKEVTFEEQLMRNFMEIWESIPVEDTTENQRKAMRALKERGFGDQQNIFSVEVNHGKSMVYNKNVVSYGVSTVVVLVLFLLWRQCWCRSRGKSALHPEYSPLLTI